MLQENRIIGQAQFDLWDKEAPASFALKLSKKLRLFQGMEIKHLLSHSYFTNQFDEARIKDLGLLFADPANTLIMVASQSISPELLNETSDVFDFSREKLSQE